MSILILGPSKWRARHHPTLPEWIPDFFPEGWSAQRTSGVTPLDVRAALVGLLVRAGCEATMMEMHASRSGETHTGLFQRLVRELPVERFLLYWPYGSQRAGLDVEIGFLLAKLEEGLPLDIRVLVEAGAHAAGRLVGTEFEALELGRRTRYYQDLVEYRCRVVEWEDYHALWNTALQHGRVAP
jgi:hypothetical protein